MNERIQELAEQASLYAVSDNSSMLFDVWKKRYTEKLAELLVRDCRDMFIVNSVSWNLLNEKLEHLGIDE